MRGSIFAPHHNTAMIEGLLDRPVSACADAIASLVSRTTAAGDYLSSFPANVDVDVSDLVNGVSGSFKVRVGAANSAAGAVAEAAETAPSAPTTPSAIAERTRDFILLVAGKRAVQHYIEAAAPVALLACLFDILLAVVRQHPSTKPNVHQCLLLATDLLFLVSSDHINAFWDYLEHRRALLLQLVFDQRVTGDRIAVLEICNNLTDRFNPKSRTGARKTDTYRKDTFNDQFEARVRIFLANVLTLEDNTGLNKYFSVANIASQDIPTSVGVNGKDDILLRDMMQINKVIRDPYFYVRPAQHKTLSSVVHSMSKVATYLLDEEDNWFKKHPREVVSVFVAEPYALSPFEEVKRGEAFEKAKREDASFAANLFDLHKTRQVTLVELFVCVSLLIELTASSKREFLASLNGAAKHFVDDSVPEQLAPQLVKIRQDIVKRYKPNDAALSEVLLLLGHSELMWWSWLILGKDKDGKPLLSVAELLQAELQAVDEKWRTMLPPKTKPYFNTYATPQLTRRMKIETGLAKLQWRGDEEEDSEFKLQQALESCKGELEKDENDAMAIQRYNIALWKLLKRRRSTQWLEFGQLARREDLAGEGEGEGDEEDDGGEANEGYDEEAAAEATADAATTADETSTEVKVATAAGETAGDGVAAESGDATEAVVVTTEAVGVTEPGVAGVATGEADTSAVDGALAGRKRAREEGDESDPKRPTLGSPAPHSHA